MVSLKPTAGRVDAHVHLSRWWPDIRRTGYRPDLDYSVPGLVREMDAAGVDAVLAIQIFQAPEVVDALAEGRAIAKEAAGRIFPVATFDPTRSEAAVTDALARIEREPGLVGLKLFPGYRSFYPHDARLDPFYELAARRHLPVLLHQGDTLDGLGLLKFARPIEVDEVASRFREISFVLCHLGNPWFDEAAELVYKNPNVYADTSGLLGSPSSPFFRRGFLAARARVEAAIVATGLPERFLLGSDWPLENLATAVELIEGLRLTDAERDGILGGNAARLFRIRPVPVHRPRTTAGNKPPRPRRRRRARGGTPVL